MIANYLIIPLYSSAGAAMALFISEFVFVVAGVYLVSRVIGRIALPGIFFKPLLATAAMGVFVYFFQFLKLHELILAATVVYFAALWIFRVFDELDWKIFRSLLNQVGAK